MMSSSSRLLVSIAVALGALAAMAGPAHALAWTPVNAFISGSASDFALRTSITTIRCTADATALTDPTGDRMSVNFRFTGCTSSLDRSAATLTCSGRATFRPTASSPGATARIQLDAGFACSLTFTRLFGTFRCAYTIRGPQTITPPDARVASTFIDVAGAQLRSTQDSPVTINCGASFETLPLSGRFDFAPTTLTISP